MKNTEFDMRESNPPGMYAYGNQVAKLMETLIHFNTFMNGAESKLNTKDISSTVTTKDRKLKIE